ncbi:MAG: WecB/TagA/CpsF family glycosyltransferase [Agathobacter sp.]|nr:WecB/TagA/CpsF family glycosyltransferase [Agathobacter sp.]MBQ3559365.1 WecB/TagA/CpsF family glycosyltransferase [Agathobacter sp.]
MIKEIIVAGIKLNSYTALENLMHIGKNLDNRIFTTVEEIYMRTLLLAKEDEVVKKVVEEMDVTVIAENGVWDAAGENTTLRKREIEKREFFFHLMQILERNKYTVFVLGGAQQEVAQTCEYIAEEFSRLNVVGAKALEECVGADEGIINDINMLAPDVIISVLPSPMQEHFLADHKAMLSARLWYGIGSGKITGQKHSLKILLLKKLRKYKLMNYIKNEKDTK